MAWIESHTLLIRHRKLLELARGLRIRPSYALGHLHALWHACLEQAEDGDISLWSDEMIADMSDFPADAPKYVQLLYRLRWLDGEMGDGKQRRLLIHDWLDYAGKYLTTKYASKRRERLVEIWAKHGRAYGSRSGVVTEVTTGQVEGNQKVTSTLPNQTKPNQTPGDPEWLERVWLNETTAKRNSCRRDAVGDATPFMAELLRVGIPQEAIEAAIVTKDRDRTEQLWEFKKRMLEAYGKNKQATPPKVYNPEDDAAAKLEKHRANILKEENERTKNAAPAKA